MDSRAGAEAGAAVATIENEGKSLVRGEFTRFCPGPAGSVKRNGLDRRSILPRR
jgi:hypothetical protein